MLRNFSKDALKYLLPLVVTAITGILIIPIVSRLFPPDEYGNYVLALATISFFSMIVGWINTSIIRFYVITKLNNKLKEFYSTVVFFLFITLIFIVFSLLIFLFTLNFHLSKQFHHFMLIGTLILILSSIFQVLQTILRAKRKAGWYSCFSVWKSVSAIGFGMTLVLLFHFGVEGLLWGGAC